MEELFFLCLVLSSNTSSTSSSKLLLLVKFPPPEILRLEDMVWEDLLILGDSGLGLLSKSDPTGMIFLRPEGVSFKGKVSHMADEE